MSVETIIIENLKRNAEMRHQIAEMEQHITSSSTHSRNLFPRLTIASLTVAACVSIFFLFNPWAATEQSPLDELNIAMPTLIEFRAASAASSQIDTLMSAQSYSAALEKIDQALKLSSENLQCLELSIVPEDEALLYEKEIATDHHYQLLWIRIYALVRLEHKVEAIDALQHFVTLNGDHAEEAKQLLVLLLSKES